MKRLKVFRISICLILMLSFFLFPMDVYAADNVESQNLYSDVDCEVFLGSGSNGNVSYSSIFAYPEYNYSSILHHQNVSGFYGISTFTGEFLQYRDYHITFYFDLAVSGRFVNPTGIKLKYRDGSSSSFNLTRTLDGNPTAYYTSPDNRVDFFAYASVTSVAQRSVVFCNIYLKPSKDLESISVECGAVGTSSGPSDFYIHDISIQQEGSGKADEGQSIVEKLEEIKNQDKQHHDEQMSQAESQHDELLNGYDKSALESEAAGIEDKVDEMESAENFLESAAGDGLDYEFDDGGVFTKFTAAAQFVNTVIAAFILKLGDFYSIVIVLFCISLAMLFIGRRK